MASRARTSRHHARCLERSMTVTFTPNTDSTWSRYGRHEVYACVFRSDLNKDLMRSKCVKQLHSQTPLSVYETLIILTIPSSQTIPGTNAVFHPSATPCKTLAIAPLERYNMIRQDTDPVRYINMLLRECHVRTGFSVKHSTYATTEMKGL